MLSCGMLCSNKTEKEGATNTSKNVNDCQKHYVGQNKPGRQKHILYFSIKFQNNKQSNDGQAMNEGIGGKKSLAVLNVSGFLTELMAPLYPGI